jgi:hypothetical protein
MQDKVTISSDKEDEHSVKILESLQDYLRCPPETLSDKEDEHQVKNLRFLHNG